MVTIEFRLRKCGDSGARSWAVQVDPRKNDMTNQPKDSSADVNALINSMVKKLEANRELLNKSLSYGRLIWRRKNGKTEIELELKI